VVAGSLILVNKNNFLLHFLHRKAWEKKKIIVFAVLSFTFSQSRHPTHHKIFQENNKMNTTILFSFKDQYFILSYPSLSLVLNFSHLPCCLSLSHILANLFSRKIPFISFNCKTFFFPNLMSFPVSLFHSRSSYFFFEHHSPVPHYHPLKPSLTSPSLLHPQKMTPHTEILFFSSHFCYSNLLA